LGINALREHQAGGAIMAKRKKQPSKAQRKKTRTARPKARKVAKVARGKATKRTVARGKPKRAQVKKAAKPVSATTVAMEGLSLTTATGIEEAEASQVI
jgi:hypothetical protein